MIDELLARLEQMKPEERPSEVERAIRSAEAVINATHDHLAALTRLYAKVSQQLREGK